MDLSVIRRRCMEKNWKKLIARRHARAEAEEADQSPQASAVKSPIAADAPAKQPESAAGAGARRPKQEKKPDSETVGIAKRQLEVRVCAGPRSVDVTGAHMVCGRR